MYWKNVCDFIKRWGIIGVLFVPFIILIFLDITTDTSANIEKYHDLIEFISWIFAGIMSLVTFSTLFLAFTYENKLIVASKNQKSILKPYTLNQDDLRNTIINYQISINEDRILKFIFYGFIIISFFSLLIWGTAVGVYTNFRMSFSIDLSVGSLLVFGIYSFYVTLFIVMLLLSIAIKLIILNKDPLTKGFLSTTTKVCDVNYIVENKGDVGELFLKNPISIDFFRNPDGKKFRNEVIFNLPINFSNFRYVVKFYNEENINLVTFYGKTKYVIDEFEVATSYSRTIHENFDEAIYKQLLNSKGCYGICKIYDKDYKVISRYYLSKENNDNKNFNYIISKKINTKFKIDHDGNLIKAKDSSDFCYYQVETGKIL